MKFREFGEKNRPAVLLVEDLDQPLTEEIIKDYHVIIPVQDGRETSVAQEADTVEHYVRQQEAGKLYAICGSAGGWKLIRELLQRQGIHSDKVIFENGEEGQPRLITAMLKQFALEHRIGRQGTESLG